MSSSIFSLRALLSVLALACAIAPTAAAADDLKADVTRFRQAHEKDILSEFVDLLSLPNVATNVADIERNAAFIRGKLEAREFATKLLSGGPGTPPAVFGELRTPGATRTILLYAHYDGQPVSQLGWSSDPFRPVVRAGADAARSTDVDWRRAARLDPEWRVYARSASDDKAPIQALLTALDALKASGRRPAVNIKVFYEGEEEQGSAHLESILENGKSELSGDTFILSDGPRHQSGAMEVFFGARGSTALDLTVYGPFRPLHDGHYGNWAPNPAVMLVHLLASMRDEDGRIQIPGFYDDVRPVSAAERRALSALPNVESGLREELALGRTEGSERLAESLERPALNVRGIRVGDVGDKASNTISAEARASIDFRLVPEETPSSIRAKVERFLDERGWFVVSSDPDAATRRAHPKVVKLEWGAGYAAYKADIISPSATIVTKGIERAIATPIIRMPILGGSVPMEIFARNLNMPIIGVPLANYDNNQHGQNENLRLQNLWDAIDIYAQLIGS